MQRAREKILRLTLSPTAKGGAIILSGNLLGQLIAVISTPLLTRVYDPSILGVYGIFTSIVSVVAVISSMRYELAIALPKEDAKAASLLVVSAIASLLIAVLILILCFIFKNELIALTGLTNSAYLFLIPLSGAIIGVQQASLQYLLRTNSYYNYAISRVFQGSSIIILQIVFGLVTGYGIFIGDSLGKVFIVLLLVYFVSKNWSRVSFQCSNLLDIAKAYSQFPKYNLPAAMLGALSINLPIIIINSHFTSAAGGHFYMAYRLLSLPVQLLSQAIGQVFLATASRIYANGLPIDTITKDTIRNLSIAGGSLILGLNLVTRDNVSIILGEAWGPLYSYVLIMSPWFIFMLISSPISHVMNISGKQKQSLIFTIVEFTLRCSILYASIMYNNIFLAAMGLSIVGSVISVSGLLMFVIAAKASVRKVILDLLKVLLTAFSLLALTLAFRNDSLFVNLIFSSISLLSFLLIIKFVVFKDLNLGLYDKGGRF
ncbi:oligosaccharide flippase family protein [Deinococcus detaillensis]|uniref:Oligosaccharide flippase family protein n=1 Tax=Deinococcus detaillensis TaxID=2592048 RepID=A0A553UMP4_9DEIO|nr:oligosaccharide flippase family protein [Deinococcus detaillensis]TSA81463.1 oligosaccharide flippase family protein [Deinococcus detaillensis]